MTTRQSELFGENLKLGVGFDFCLDKVSVRGVGAYKRDRHLH